MDLLSRTPYAADEIPVFRPDLETATGGFKLDITGLAVGSVIPAGSAIGFDEITRIAKVVKAATVYANVGASATVINVKKGSAFVAGDFIASANGAKASTIVSIDKSNALYDAITIDVAIGAITAGAGVFQSLAASTTTGSAPLIAIKGLLKANTYVSAKNTLVDVVVKGTVYARRIPPVIAAFQAQIPLILFSYSQ